MRARLYFGWLRGDGRGSGPWRKVCEDANYFACWAALERVRDSEYRQLVTCWCTVLEAHEHPDAALRMRRPAVRPR